MSACSGALCLYVCVCACVFVRTYECMHVRVRVSVHLYLLLCTCMSACVTSGVSRQGTQQNDERALVWSDGTAATVAVGYWQNGQPDTGDGQCVLARMDNGRVRWSFVPCERKSPYVCQRAAAPLGRYTDGASGSVSAQQEIVALRKASTLSVMSVGFFFFLLVLLRSPAVSLGFASFGEIFPYVTVFNTTIEVLTSRLRG